MKNIQPPRRNNEQQGQQAALEIIKARIRELYGEEPEEKATQPRPQSELINHFWETHKDDPNPESAWQRFYEGLADEEKVALWNEYHAINSTAKLYQPALDHQKSYQDFAVPEAGDDAEVETGDMEIPEDTGHAASFEPPKREKGQRGRKAKRESKRELLKTLKSQPQLNRKRSRRHWAPLFISLFVGVLVLFAQYNPLIIALAKQYISPGDTLRSPVIIDPNANIEIGPDPRIIIPKINVDVPVVYTIDTRNEEAIQAGLEDGVVHYSGTSVPGEAGNNVIVGHSSNNFLNSGKYKFAFVLLDRLELNDTFILHYEGVRYVYKVVNKQTVEPNDFSLIGGTAKPTATLITCTPPGTSWRRLIIQGEQISPEPTPEQLTGNTENSNEVPESGIVPGNAPSLWDRLTN